LLKRKQKSSVLGKQQLLQELEEKEEEPTSVLSSML
jgi:hypothetical protein